MLLLEETKQSYLNWCKLNHQWRGAATGSATKTSLKFQVEQSESIYRQRRQQLTQEEEQAFREWLEKNAQIVR